MYEILWGEGRVWKKEKSRRTSPHAASVTEGKSRRKGASASLEGHLYEKWSLLPAMARHAVSLCVPGNCPVDADRWPAISRPATTRSRSHEASFQQQILHSSHLFILLLYNYGGHLQMLPILSTFFFRFCNLNICYSFFPLLLFLNVYYFFL